MIKIATPPFYNGINLLMLDSVPSLDVFKRIMQFDIKCYYRTFDEIHPKAMLDVYPKHDERCLIVTINPSVIDHFHCQSPQHTMDSMYFLHVGNILSLTFDDANRVYHAYSAGIEHVSEILLTRGYWNA